jgi:hypothetical protein
MFALFVSPLSALSIRWASLIYYFVNFLSLLIFLYISGKLLVPGSVSIKDFFILYTVPLVFSIRFIQGVLDSGQVTLIVCALAALGLYGIQRRRPILGAAVLALSTMLKYTPFIFIPYLFLRKKVFAGLWTLVFIGVYLIAPALHVGMEKQMLYLKGWFPSIVSNSLDQGSWTDHKNQSLPSWVVRCLMRRSPYIRTMGISLCGFATALKIGLGLCLLLYLCILWPTRGPFQNCADLGMLFLGMALWNANAWPFNFVVLIFAVMAVLSLWRGQGYRGRAIPVLLAAVFILLNIGSEALVHDSGQRTCEIISLLTIAALLLYLFFIARKFKRIEAPVILR